MKQYLDLLYRIKTQGIHKSDRTNVGTTNLFAQQLKFNLSQGFPLITTKKIHFKSVVYELLWFLQGVTNIGYLKDNGVKIWDKWADESGELGPIYGRQWRSWSMENGDCIDQISQVVHAIKTEPNSRRLLVSAWNVGQLHLMALPPCHVLFQFYVADGYLSCQLYQRSADMFLGVPFNITSYSLLLSMIAQQCELKAGEFIWTGGDCHIYDNHQQQVSIQMARKPLPLPTLKLNKAKDIFSYQFNDIQVVNYQHGDIIKADVAV